MSTITITNNFNAPIGQHIDHVDKIEAHFDKDMQMQVTQLPADNEDTHLEDQSSAVDTTHSCDLYTAFAQAIIAIQDQLYSDGRPYIREIRDHAALEHLAEEFGIIKTYNQHSDYIAYLDNMSKQGFTFSQHPTRVPCLSTYVNCIISTNPDKWTCTKDIDKATFDRYLALAKLVRIECHKRFVLG